MDVKQFFAAYSDAIQKMVPLDWRMTSTHQGISLVKECFWPASLGSIKVTLGCDGKDMTVSTNAIFSASANLVAMKEEDWEKVERALKAAAAAFINTFNEDDEEHEDA